MTYLFSNASNATIINEVEVKNDIGNTIPVTATINLTGVPVSQSNPFPVTLGSNNITIVGNTFIVDEVTVSSTPERPVHVHLTEVGISGNLQVPYMPIQGNVNVLNPVSNITATITSLPPVEVNNDSGNALSVIFSDSVQMDTTERLRTSVLGQQWWYVPSVDKDGDLRIQEKFQGNGASSTFIQNLASVRMTSAYYYSANSKLTGTAIRASRRRHKTRPGVSAEWTGIVNWDGLQSNVVKRIGMFTDYNGLFFEANATSVNTVIRRRLTDGTLFETRTPHTAWNKDKMDGKGPSKYDWSANNVIIANVSSVISTTNVAISGDGTVYVVQYQMDTGEETKLTIGKKVTLTGLNPVGFNDTGLVTSIDTTNHRANVTYIAFPGTYISATNAKMTNTPFHAIHNYWFDYSGSRVARVRFGLKTDAGKIIVHEYTQGEIGTQWTNAPAFMDRKEIVNVAQPVDFLPSLTVAGSAVSVETSAEINPGFGVAQSNLPIGFNKNTDLDVEYALLGIAIRAGEPYQRADVQVQGIQFVDIGNLNPQNAGIFQWRLVLNPTVINAASGIPSATNIGKATRMWDYYGNTTISGGLDLLGGYAQGTFTNDVKAALNFLNMGSNIDYTDSDKLVLAVKLIRGGSSDSSILGTISFLEDL